MDRFMNYHITGILIILLCLLAFCGGPAHAGSTQTNTSGSNTAIEGGYTSTATTTYQSGSESTTTTNNTTNSDIRSSPPTAGAPSYNSMTQDVCAVGGSLGVQTFGLGISGGKHFIDKNCERLKLARILQDFGMKVAAVAILCQDERVFEAMIQAGTPCPIDGKIGKEAKALWSKYDHERPDYDIYIKRMKEREKKEKEIARKIAKEQEKEQEKITKEFEAIELNTTFDKKVQEKIKKKIEWSNPK
jgi:DNA-binding transcriptional MerR regulator|tara:strand:+ start:561 stop:1298 length:738 start_codon:yes stop_codon:yes gene_type:complete